MSKIEATISKEAAAGSYIQADEQFDTANVLTISFAHAVHDTYSAFVAPLLPVLIENFSLTRTLAGSLTIFLQLPSLLTPIIGHAADRVNLRPFVIVAPALTGIFLSLIGITPYYVVIALLLLLSGFSSAALHAVGPVMVGLVSGKRLGQGMSFWMVGGELGRVLGPIVIVTALGYLTLEGLPWLMIGGILVTILLYFRLRDVEGLVAETSNGLSFWQAARQMKPLLIPLTFLVMVRAFMSSALTTYLPTFLTDEGASLWFAGASLSVLEAAGVVGALLAGSISDRIGRRRVLIISLATSPLFMFAFLAVRGGMQIPMLLLLGFSSISITPVIMALVQENYPENRALANGIYMALNFVIRAIMILLIGLIGDSYGLRLAFLSSGILMLLGIPLPLLLPRREAKAAG